MSHRRTAVAGLLAAALALPAGASPPKPAAPPTAAATSAVKAKAKAGAKAGPKKADPHLPFVDGDYARALADARARNVPLVVDVWAPW